MDFKKVISGLLQRFDASRVRYGLIGGFAVGLWGGSGTTVDLDFLVEREDLDKVDAAMKEMGYERRFKSENVSQYISSRPLFGEVDFLHAFRETSRQMLERAETKEIFDGEFKIKVLRPEDLIGLKMQAVKNSPSRKESDMADIKTLVLSQKGKLDWELIKNYTEILEAQDLLKEFYP